MQPAYISLLPVLPVLLAHLAGAVASVVLLMRQERRNRTALLALIGFAALFMADLANLAKAPLTQWVVRRSGPQQFWAINTGLGCCCSIIDVAAIVCLIMAVWQAVGNRAE